MIRPLAVASAVSVSALLALSGTAQARTVSWGGTGFNDLGPASAILSVANGKAKVPNVQLVMACTDTEDHSESDRAFSARYRTATALRRNRFTIEFAANSGGRLGQVRLTGTLGSNGRGTIRVQVNAVAQGDDGSTIERCQGETRFAMRRGG